ncbi:MAG: response regulator [Candidatus Omnitrophica bacterium]|nr:response regulator [Candidatus Omnitrophota bacterium]MDD5552802.1 response regulator [Candidatus Omnitrophota bacterium]
MSSENAAKSKILICDDDKSVTEFLERFLKNEGYNQVEVVSGGAEVLEKVVRQHYDLVLLDIKMPGMDGIEVLQLIKKVDEKAAVVMITGFPEENLAAQALKMGAYDYIVKPFDLAYLKLVVFSRILLDPGKQKKHE